MDRQNAELFSALIEGHLAHGRAWLASNSSSAGRGRHLVTLINKMLSDSDTERQRLMRQLDEGSEEARFAVRGLERLLREIEVLLPTLQPFLNDVKRRDLPTGLHVAVDTAIDQLLPHSGDPIIHMDDEHMYSTLDLHNALNKPQNEEVSPIVFFLPASDPFNTLLLPIIVHEVGHSAVRQADLVSRTINAAIDALNDLLARYVAEIKDMSLGDAESPRDLQIRLLHWIEELICDALAAFICGPAYLFASIAFLPMTAEGDMPGSHPFPKDRVRLVLEWLNRLGWNETLNQTAPQTVQWLQESIAAERTQAPVERFLRDACSALNDHVFSIANSHVSNPLLSEEYSTIGPTATQGLKFGIPPTAAGKSPESVWNVILSGWEYAFDKYGDAPASIARAVNDAPISRSLLWGIERSRIAELWKGNNGI